ncbi:hypothetical protein TL16_g03605 [Triparma laevis f. inornata]|uniref:Uncharacterized protein n=2 Tax=Triparma laevis TaxID=1534972 RepID=A0A9W7FFY6_9STRA|nr:hypothetical protein TL16_g03605 [Triparma laevis f. inornata]GMI11348.1 hypothetical protein TrLO_g7775 [Triparma laevis f. longispina]
MNYTKKPTVELPEDVMGYIIGFIEDYNIGRPSRLAPQNESIESKFSTLHKAAQIYRGFWFHTKRRRKQIIEQDRPNKELRARLQEWCRNKVAAEIKYGHIKHWDVSDVTEMNFLFGSMDGENGWSAGFDEDITHWDARNVKEMIGMFRKASSYTGRGVQHWNVENVTDTSFMFCDAPNFNANLSS